METFEKMGLPKILSSSLEAMKFLNPTPIQAKAIPIALEGKDILGSAQTGTGKTGAYGIPLASHLILNNLSTAIIITPTRELATQVIGQLDNILGKKSNIKSALLIGGDSLPKQLARLRIKPRLIVGTPGRINDHLKRGSLKLRNTDFVVLDETDRMLDMGFMPQIENILKSLAPVRQTLMFSATMPQNIVNIANNYLNNPVRIDIKPSLELKSNIKQDILHINESEKYENLISELEHRQGSVIIFMKTKHSTEKMALKLENNGFTANAIHGDLRQSKRDRVINAFRNNKYRILVATDIAARGIDIPHIEHVINYDLPQCEEDYIHRIGRTARAGAKGMALNFVTPSDRRKWNSITKLFAINDKSIETSKSRVKSKLSVINNKQSDKRYRPKNKFLTVNDNEPSGKPKSKFSFFKKKTIKNSVRSFKV